VRYPAGGDQHRVARVQLDLVAVINLESNREWDGDQLQMGSLGAGRETASSSGEARRAGRTFLARKILPCDGEVTHFSYRFKFSCVGAIMKNTFLPEST
jgi:hypothetical protein